MNFGFFIAKFWARHPALSRKIGLSKPKFMTRNIPILFLLRSLLTCQSENLKVKCR